MKYKHIIWDWNGTLLDDIDLSLSIINKILKDYDKNQVSADEYKNIFSFPVSGYYSTLGFSSDDFGSLNKIFIGEYEKNRLNCNIHHNAKDFLDKNAKSGITQSILSAYKQDTLKEIVGFFKLDEYFVKLVGQQDIYAGSKVKQGQQLVLDLGINTKDIILIGDTYHDYEVAKEIGVDCILISHGHNSVAKLASSNRLVVENISELEKVLWIL